MAKEGDKKKQQSNFVRNQNRNKSFPNGLSDGFLVLLCTLSFLRNISQNCTCTFKYWNLCSTVWPCVVTVSVFFSKIKMKRFCLKESLWAFGTERYVFFLCPFSLPL